MARLTGPGVRRLLRPLARRARLRREPLEGGRRLILVQLDGVSRARLRWALGEGQMPFVARRLDEGSLCLSAARAGAPTSTPAFQAGLLYGVSPSVPGFVWYDREGGREVRMDRASDAAAVEARLSMANPPLLRRGTSYFSIFSGGASAPRFCLSGLSGEPAAAAPPHPLSGWDAIASALVHSLTFTRTAGRLLYELTAGAWQGAAWSLSRGRMKHEARFLLHRMAVGAFMRELAVEGVILDVARGVPITFCDLMGYDEYAHRRGPDSATAVAQLRSIDCALAAIFAAAEAVPELRYDVYVFSDHGHIATEPFQSLTGLSLPEYLALTEGGVSVPRRVPREEAVRLAQTRSLRALLATRPGLAGGYAGRALDRVERGLIGHALGFARLDRVVTAEAGDLAHVYFTDGPSPLSLDEVRARHPGALHALRESRAVGLVAARGGERGVALFRGQELDLARAEQVTQLPHPEPALLATYLADLVSLPASGDLVVLGWRGEGRPSVAYAWEFGSHGGVAPEEIEIFFLHPPRCGLPFADGLRPDALYHLFHDAYRVAPGRRPLCVETAPEERARP